MKARFLARSWLGAGALAPMLRAAPGSSLHRYMEHRPDTSGFLVWPYQCASWGVAERAERIAQHFDILDRLGPPFPFPVDDKLLLWDLGRYSPGTRILLDQPKWLFREGLLALNLFCGSHRAYSLAFSLCREPDGVCVFIGGLQGRSTDGAQETYRTLTKAFHGMRPRDLLLDALRMLAPLLGAQRILAVADDHRYLKHAYFGGGVDTVHSDYDGIWHDRGGRRVQPSHFELPLTLSVRALEDIPTRKRAQYRRRNEMLESLLGEFTSPAGRPLLRFDAT